MKVWPAYTHTHTERQEPAVKWFRVDTLVHGVSYMLCLNMGLESESFSKA